MIWSAASWNSDSETRPGAKMPSSYALALTKKKKKKRKKEKKTMKESNHHDGRSKIKQNTLRAHIHVHTRM